MLSSMLHSGASGLALLVAQFRGIFPTLLQVWDGNELIKTVPRTTKGEIRKKKAEPHRKRIK
jgi:hypothetical protein